MTYCKVSPAERLFHGVVALNIWIGIFLTGFGNAHWWLYIPGVFLVVSAVTGFCTGMEISRRLFPSKPPVGQ
jgi:hypothetical protein